MFRLIRIPDYLTMVYCSDIATTILTIMVWGDFPNTNPYTVAIVNTAILWALFKTLVYIAVVIGYNVAGDHMRVVENIAMVVTLIFCISVFYNLSRVHSVIPQNNISADFIKNTTVAFKATNINFP